MPRDPHEVLAQFFNKNYVKPINVTANAPQRKMTPEEKVPRIRLTPFIGRLLKKAKSEASKISLRDKKFTIIVATNSLTSEPFLTCYVHIKKYTMANFQIVGVESHFNEPLYNHARDMNIALKGAESDYIVLINDDLYVFDGWLEALVAPTMKDPRIGVVGGLFLYPDSRTIQHAGHFYDSLGDNEGKIYWGHRFQFENIETTPEALIPCPTIGVTGALMLVKRECIKNVGVWDDVDFPLGWNDPDFCIRAWQKGWKTYYNPCCIAIHHEGYSINRMNYQSVLEKRCWTKFQAKWSKEKLSKVSIKVDDQIVIPWLKKIRGK
jgi:cellulose synthase/poly-beta-1,6-N-acetylglucosamine synthase-like glycosyltransferase